MTGRPIDPIPDPSLATIERRLERRPPADPPPGLRSRVLGAVDQTIAPPRPIPRRDDAVRPPAWAWAAVTAMGIALTVPVVSTADALCRSERRAFVTQLRDARVSDESLLNSLASDPRPGGAAVAVRPARDAVPQRPESRLIELRRLLEEML